MGKRQRRREREQKPVPADYGSDTNTCEEAPVPEFTVQAGLASAESAVNNRKEG